MAMYLSEEWHRQVCDLSRAFPEVPGASARMSYVVSGGPAGEIRYHQVTENGRITDQGLGDCPDADFTFSVSWADAVSVQKGDLDPNVAFMQGRMKVSGNMGKVMSLLPLTLSPHYHELQEKLRAVTEYA